jgi:hypothetical protein
VSETVPGGVPPVLISAPSRPEKRLRAAAISRLGVSGSLLSAATQVTALVRAASSPSLAAAAAAVASRGELSTIRAPSATSASAAANPRPRLPPVTRYTLSRSPRSMRPTPNRPRTTRLCRPSRRPIDPSSTRTGSGCRDARLVSVLSSRVLPRRSSEVITDFGCDRCRDDQNRLYGHVIHIASSPVSGW